MILTLQWRGSVIPELETDNCYLSLWSPYLCHVPGRSNNGPVWDSGWGSNCSPLRCTRRRSWVYHLGIAGQSRYWRSISFNTTREELTLLSFIKDLSNGIVGLLLGHLMVHVVGLETYHISYQLQHNHAADHKCAVDPKIVEASFQRHLWALFGGSPAPLWRINSYLLGWSSPSWRANRLIGGIFLTSSSSPSRRWTETIQIQLYLSTQIWAFFGYWFSASDKWWIGLGALIIRCLTHMWLWCPRRC